MAYFDWNATAPLLPQARQAWLEAQERYWANPSTAYRTGLQARLVLDRAREDLAQILGADPEGVVFTSGATEANNGLMRALASSSRPEGTVLLSAVEHPAVREAALLYWGSTRVREIPVSADGVVALDQLERELGRQPPALVSVMAANNETGVIQPWSVIRDLCRKAGIPFHCDAAQWPGKEPLCGLGACDAVTLSGHKFGGPKGVGALILGPSLRGVTVLAGGAQEQGSRAGTEDIPGILSMMAALRYRLEHPPTPDRRAARDSFESALTALWPESVCFHGQGVPRLWNTASVCLPDFRSDRWIAQLDRLGYAVSSGSACSTGKEGPSPVLAAMGVEPDSVRRTLRISSGPETAPEDWEGLLHALQQARRNLETPGSSSGPGKVIEL